MDGGIVEVSEPDRLPEFDFDFDFNFDFDSLLPGFNDDFADPFLSESGSPNSLVSDPTLEPRVSEGVSDAGSPGSISSYVTELEKFLMADADAEEDGVKELDDAFFAGFFADSSDDGPSEAATPEAESVDKENEEEEAPVEVDSEDEDPINKKRRRQMRNRDSAMKSRERKKMYIKELEMKSKYLESECRRLNYALQCCAAENMALHQRLQKERFSDDLTAKQESAALFVESLLLGSLFWLVSIVCLFLIPRLTSQSPRITRNPERGHVQLVAARKANEKLVTNFWLQLALIGRRFRGMKMRMKSILFPVVYLFL